MSEQQEREAVVAEALSWQRTPYHHNARVKGSGVDCAMLLAEVYPKVVPHLVPPITPEHYPPDWHLHRSKERYLEYVLKNATEIPEAEAGAGDVVMFKFGRCFSHGAIIVKWPKIVHAYVGIGCQLEDANGAQWLRYRGEAENQPRERRFFTLWPKARAEAQNACDPPKTPLDGGL